MSPSVAIGLGGAAFVLALGVTLWVEHGAVIFEALTAFGVLICG